jgi:copper resistance protein C
MKRALALLTVVGLAFALPAWAHTSVQTTAPKKNTTVKRSLKTVSVTFHDQIQAGSLTVSTSAGRVVSKGHGGIDPRDVRRALVPLRTGLKAGAYVAKWKITAADGHLQHGSWKFRLR